MTISTHYSREEMEKVNDFGRKESARLAALAPEREKLRAFLAQVDALVVPQCAMKDEIATRLFGLRSAVETYIHATGGTRA
jgi:uncharacterized protein YlaN (UPF0358 family)